jgi:hypothetical protein
MANYCRAVTKSPRGTVPTVRGTLLVLCQKHSNVDTGRMGTDPFCKIAERMSYSSSEQRCRPGMFIPDPGF